MTREEILAVAKPILFNTDMVRAIQEDRKSETRRLIKPRYRDDEYGFQVVTCEATDAKYIEKTDENEMGFDPPRYINQRYQTGDYLYIRETWCRNDDLGEYYYAAKRKRGAGAPDGLKWKPSIHMPKEAARIFLRVTDVNLERLKNIGDCTKEGIASGTHATAHMNDYDERCAFAALWNSTIPKEKLDKYGWDANPWVWVYRFEKVEV